MPNAKDKPKYPWPASQLNPEMMRRLYAESQKSQKPITQLIREALEKQYQTQ